MMSKTNVIDLQKYLTPGSRVFTGRDRGIEVRTKSEIDKLEAISEELIVVIPENVGSINPSFLEEFLFNIVVKLKAEAFFNKVKFASSGRYKIDNDLQEAVERILREETALIH
jgi:hypothetical protein